MKRKITVPDFEIENQEGDILLFCGVDATVFHSKQTLLEPACTEVEIHGGEYMILDQDEEEWVSFEAHNYPECLQDSEELWEAIRKT